MKKIFYLLIIAALLIAALTECNKDVKDVAVTGVKLDENSLTLEVGETKTIIATVLPENATNKLVTWISRDTTVATISSSGEIMALSAGETKIEVTTMEGNYTAKCKVTVISVEPEEKGIIINGIKWATRNLAAHGKFAENPEDYGALFQWGRTGDGHEQHTSPNYPTNDNSFENGLVDSTGLDADGQIVNTHAAYGKFIKTIDTLFDWRTPQNNLLWNSGTETTPVKTVNDPCPAGWRVPTKTELKSLENSVSEIGKLNGIFGRYYGDGTEKLFLPAAGYRGENTGTLYGMGESMPGINEYLYYWSSTPIGEWAYLLCYFSEDRISRHPRAGGLSVRCVAE